MTGLVFIGVKGCVLALDGSTGTELWRTSLSGADFVSVALVGGDLYAGTRGELFCLDPTTGAVRWHNPLKGLGRGLLSIATPSGQGVLPAEDLRRKRQAAAAAAASASS